MSEKRHITIITANYYPEDTAIGLYTNQFSRFLVEKKHGSDRYNRLSLLSTMGYL
jgi:hypothetical protein